MTLHDCKSQSNFFGLGTQVDPLQPSRFLRSGRSPKCAIFELGFYEAEVGELTQPAKTRTLQISSIAVARSTVTA